MEWPTETAESVSGGNRCCEETESQRKMVKDEASFRVLKHNPSHVTGPHSVRGGECGKMEVIQVPTSHALGTARPVWPERGGGGAGVKAGVSLRLQQPRVGIAGRKSSFRMQG